MNQQTIRQAFQLDGVGIHTGVTARVTVQPAPPDAGRTFRVGNTEIPAHVQYVTDTARCTTLGRAGVTVSTVEHLLSALAGCGVDNCTMIVEGPEVPILDGSALPIVIAIQSAGLQAQDRPARFVEPEGPVAYSAGGSDMRAEPAEILRVQVTTEFVNWPEGAATLTAEGAFGVPDDYATAIASARTFAFKQEVDMLIAAGLAKGGSLDNALIIDPPHTYSSSVRVPAEWCAHKLLDVLGDLALLNARLRANVTALRPGHRANTALAAEILAHSRT